MSTITVSLTEFKQNLGAMINQASFGGERIVLLSHGKERAALISMDDLRLLESMLQASHDTYQTRQLNLLNEARVLRESMAEAGYQTDSTAALDEVREERLDDLTDLR